MLIKNSDKLFPDVTKLTFEEERNLNDPTWSFKGPMEIYRKSFNEKLGYGLYEWEDIEFANTDIAREAAIHFQTYERYNNIDQNKNPHSWDKWWDREEYRRVHGITLPIRMPKGGVLSHKELQPLWIPGNMYGHLNYGPIKRVVDDAPKVTIPGQKVSSVDDLFAGLTDREVRSKKVDFPDFWDGHFHTYIAMHAARRLGKSIAILKARRKGFSYIGAWDAFDKADMYPNTTVILVAYDLKYLNKGRGLFVMVKEYSDHINLHTEWGKRRVKDTQTELMFGFRYNKSRAIGGYKSEIIAVSAADNPDVVRGKDPNKILWEECGTFPNLLSSIEATEAALEAGGYSTGNSQYWGTVGSAEADYHGLSMLFYSPAGYNCLPFNNIYDVNKRNTASSMFFGMFQNFEGSIDKYGNSDKVLAQKIFEKQKEIKRANSRRSDYEKWLAERANTPSEALSRKGNNLFSPHADAINEQIQKIEHDPEIKQMFAHGRYKDIGGKVVFVSNESLKANNETWHPPIDDMFEFLPKDMDFHGCVTEIDKPYTIKTPDEKGGLVESIPKGLYYGWHDPYATDKDSKDISQENSLGVTYIYERANNFTPSRGDRLVAWWIGRPPTTDGYNDQLFLMLRRWNAELMFENDRGDVIPYARRTKLTKYLMEEPEMLSLKEYNIQGKTGRNFGISIQKHPLRKSTGAILLRDHLGNVNSYASDGNHRTFISHTYCKLFLRQLLAWNKDGNFDAVSAAIVGMYQVRETLEHDVKSNSNNQQEYTYEPDFWSSNFF